MATPRSRTASAAPASMQAARTLSCIRALVAALAQSARSVERRTGITNAQLFVLQLLASEPMLSINELAARALTQQSTISLLVTRLAHAGLVHRERSDDDARRARVVLTAKGQRMVRRAPTPPMARMIAAVETLAPADLRGLERGLGALLKAMKIATSGDALMFESRTPVA
ncbi:MAG TPA: MarR family transcriptional regulator [Gemmatimonadaceae bacterium]